MREKGGLGEMQGAGTGQDVLKTFGLERWLIK